MKHKMAIHFSDVMNSRRTPVALAVILLHGLALAQPALNTTSADLPEAKSLFETGGQAGIGPRPFTSFLERISSPVSRIGLKVEGENLPADGISATNVQLRLMDKDGQRIQGDIDVTIEVDGGARVLMPGRLTSESGADRGDIDRITPGIQQTVKNGALQFKLIAPYKPDPVTLKVSVKGVVEKVVVRYVPDLRDFIAVGLIEGRLRSDKFDPRKIVPVHENDGFDNELKGFTKDFNGGKSSFGARAAVYLKGKVKGDYLLTLAYDSDKNTRSNLFADVDPNAFYPVYGDSSVRGVDAQSTGKLYVRIDNKFSYLLLGDYTTADSNPARTLSQYSRSLPGVRGHYEEGRVTANAFVAQQSFRQVTDEFPARGVSGPYSVSNPNGISGSEKIEILTRDRYRPTNIIKVTPVSRNLDYEFEPFSGQILFRSPIPSFDDQLNPVSIRVVYEVEQGGDKYFVYGGDVRLKITEGLSVGIAAARDENPAAIYEVTGANLTLKLSKNTELIAEVARTSSVVNNAASGFNTNVSSAFAGKSGELQGNAARVEIRHADDDLRYKAYSLRSSDDFNNASSGVTGGKTELGASGSYRANEKLSFTGELLSSKNRLIGSENEQGAIGVDLKVSDRLTIGGGVRRVQQNSISLAQTTAANCTNNLAGTSTTPGAIAGYNTGYGISPVGNQSIDPATGLPVLCDLSVNANPGVPSSLERTSLFVRASYKATDSVTLDGELQNVTGTDPTSLYRLGARWAVTSKLNVSAETQREFNSSGTGLYRLGADWSVADKTRLYTRYERATQYSGAYGLGVGPVSDAFTLGIDTQYMEDGSLYSEYRLRDSASGKEVQRALGLRNGWRVAEGLRLTTSVERLASTGGDATSIGTGLEYTASQIWKASGRVEWREDNNNTNWLFTAGVARKLDRDWTLLAREYASLIKPRTALGTDKVQSRFQVGFAYRPVDNNKFDALGLYERKNNRDLTPGAEIDSNTDIISFRGNYHPSRVWWLSGRYAYKNVSELLLGTVNDSYRAQLLGGRVTYDVTNRWSLGGIVSVLQGSGGDRQYAYGLEVGYILMDNLYATLGYNWRGFSSSGTASGLTGNDYTNQGWVLGLRYKFDEDLFRKSDPAANKTLNPNVLTP
ncbi:MAG: porin family protein [Polaromonas sp.]|nr:porin family protein [Polaromonas sp.]